ncbi:alpha-D-phosphohexomutase superfamily protein [Tanacetum coccineum]
MQHIHIGLAMIRIHTLHWIGAGTNALVSLQDTRWSNTTRIISTMEVDLAQGTQLVYMVPDMMTSINDFHDHLRVSIQTHCYEAWQASHLPYNKNGFKFFTNAGGLGKADIKDILERTANIYSGLTAESLKEAERKASSLIKNPLEGFHIVVDVGNKAGGFFAGKVLEPLGLFPNHIPNPEDKAAVKAIAQAVLDNKADLGIIFDTNVDRSAAVDSTGREFNRNRLIALMSAIILEENPGTTIVTDSVTSDGLTTFIEKKLVIGKFNIEQLYDAFRNGNILGWMDRQWPILKYSVTAKMVKHQAS